MHRLEKIVIYPIKALSGIELDSCMALEAGLELDRRFMIVDSEGRFISQRTYPTLAKVKVSISDHLIGLKYENSTIEFNKDEFSDNMMSVSIWDHHNLKASLISKSLDRFFSDLLGKTAHLVKYNDKTLRVKTLSNKEFTDVSFADGYPFLTIGTASLSSLSQRVGKEIPAHRFRANFIINTKVEHEEDAWNEFQIGDAIFKNVKPCVRCSVPNIDQEKAIIDKDKEPNKTLSSYRNFNGKIFFGSNVRLLKEGKISVGDAIRLIDEKNKK